MEWIRVSTRFWSIMQAWQKWTFCMMMAPLSTVSSIKGKHVAHPCCFIRVFHPCCSSVLSCSIIHPSIHTILSSIHPLLSSLFSAFHDEWSIVNGSWCLPKVPSPSSLTYLSWPSGLTYLTYQTCLSKLTHLPLPSGLTFSTNLSDPSGLTFILITLG